MKRKQIKRKALLKTKNPQIKLILFHLLALNLILVLNKEKGPIENGSKTTHQRKRINSNSPDRMDSSPTNDKHNNSSQPQKIPKFDLDNSNMDSHRLKLPEEIKNNFEFGRGALKIDFSNDPVMKALLETKQNRFELHLQEMYLSKKCKFLYIALAFICTCLVLWTILDRKVLRENVFFILIELGVNVIVGFDIVFKIKLTG